MINSENTETTNQNTQFSDATPQWRHEIDSRPDSTFGLVESNVATLQHFMSRPVMLASYTWPVGSEIFLNFDPWTLFFQNARVRERISNFHNLRAKLHVKIVINGTSFHFGRAVAAYRPLPGFDDFTKDRSLVREDLVESSQRPKIFLNPTTSQGGILVLPFCWAENALSIPLAQWREMGNMTIRSLWPLKHANGGTDGCSITVFAWAEDVHLSVPTSTVAPQSGEYTGIVSKPMAALAKVAGMLRTVPSIAPYAMATETAAKAIGSVAHEHGYSRPVQVQSTTFMEPLAVDNCANTVGLDTSQKLSFDPKQEVTIDPRTMGLGDADEMNIRSLAARESWLTNFRWDIFNVNNQLLWNTEVSPTLWATNGAELHMPACCFTSIPFRSWRGTMKFRFQVISSAYHKGRLRISYDPRAQVTPEFNTNFNYIVDISDKTDFTIEVGWGQTRPMVEHREPGFDALPYGTTPLAAPGYKANGVLSVYVLNELTTPNTVADNDLIVAVYVSAGDDFEVFNPASGLLDDYVFAEPGVTPPALRINSGPSPTGEDPEKLLQEVGDIESSLAEEIIGDSFEKFAEKMKPQSGPPLDDILPTPDGDIPEHQDSTVCLADCTQMDAMGAVFYGDPIVSLRQILKRYVFQNALCGSNTNAYHNWTVPNYPAYRGEDPNGLHLISGGRYNFVHNVPITWFTPCFICRKGSVRWKYIREVMANGALMTINRFALASTPGYQVFPIVTTTLTVSGRSRETYHNLYSCWTGGAFTASDMKPTLSVTFPHHTSTRFCYGKSRSVNATARLDQLQNQFHNVMVRGTGGTGSPPTVYGLVAAGDDYTLSFYCSPPIVYRRDRRTDPAGV
jgi:hypothetical protein